LTSLSRNAKYRILSNIGFTNVRFRVKYSELNKGNNKGNKQFVGLGLFFPLSLLLLLLLF